MLILTEGWGTLAWVCPVLRSLVGHHEPKLELNDEWNACSALLFHIHDGFYVHLTNLVARMVIDELHMSGASTKQYEASDANDRGQHIQCSKSACFKL